MGHDVESRELKELVQSLDDNFDGVLQYEELSKVRQLPVAETIGALLMRTLLERRSKQSPIDGRRSTASPPRRRRFAASSRHPSDLSSRGFWFLATGQGGGVWGRGGG